MITTHPRLYYAICALLVLLALACAWWWPLPIHAAQPPQFSAHWDRPGIAVVTFALDAPACLYRKPASGAGVLLACYDAGSYRVTFGRSGPLDAAMRPQAGDVYVLQGAGETRRAALRGVVCLALVGDGARPFDGLRGAGWGLGVGGNAAISARSRRFGVG